VKVFAGNRCQLFEISSAQTTVSPVTLAHFLELLFRAKLRWYHKGPLVSFSTLQLVISMWLGIYCS